MSQAARRLKAQPTPIEPPSGELAAAEQSHVVETRPPPALESVAAEAAREAHPLKLSLIVPATDTPSTLEACLDAIHASFDQPGEIIVIDSATGPGAGLARNNGAA